MAKDLIIILGGSLAGNATLRWLELLAGPVEPPFFSAVLAGTFAGLWALAFLHLEDN